MTPRSIIEINNLIFFFYLVGSILYLVYLKNTFFINKSDTLCLKFYFYSFHFYPRTFLSFFFQFFLLR